MVTGPGVRFLLVPRPDCVTDQHNCFFFFFFFKGSVLIQVYGDDYIVYKVLTKKLNKKK